MHTPIKNIQSPNKPFSFRYYFYLQQNIFGVKSLNVSVGFADKDFGLMPLT